MSSELMTVGGTALKLPWTHIEGVERTLRPARAVLGSLIQPRHTGFELFSQLPFDLRAYIWRLAMPTNRVVSMEEEIEYPDSDDSDDSGDEPDENLRAIHRLDKILGRRDFFSNNGQTQLEDYGFSTTHSKPLLLNDTQLEYIVKHRWETTRSCSLYHPGPIPVLLHVCRESRQFLQSCGYELTFATRNAPAQTWFNFSSDFLFLPALDSDESSETIDGGPWNIGQFAQSDLERVRKLALQVPHTYPVDYAYGDPLPRGVYQAVKMFGNLEELLFVEGYRYSMHRKNIYWFDGNELGEIVPVDLSVEELWGHSPGWRPAPRDPWQWSEWPRRFSIDHPREKWESFDALSKYVEVQLRSEHSLAHDGVQKCRIPKVRFVLLLARHEVPQFMRSRAAYVRYVDGMYRQKAREGRRCYRPPSNLSSRLGEDSEAEAALREYESTTEPHMELRDLGWYRQAREAMQNLNGWPSPYTMEWIEASEAMLDMDTWSLAEDHET